MKLGESITRLVQLEERLECLGSRLLREHEEGRPLNHIILEIESVANRARDIKASIEWTRQQIIIGGIPLGTYSAKLDYLLKMADLLYDVHTPDLMARLDELVTEADEIAVVIETVNWSVDLQVPEVTVPAPEEEAVEEG